MRKVNKCEESKGKGRKKRKERYINGKRHEERRKKEKLGEGAKYVSRIIQWCSSWSQGAAGTCDPSKTHMTYLVVKCRKAHV